jgi:hypothetical protein
LNEARQLGKVQSYKDLRAICRAQVARMGLNYSIVDVLTGYVQTYTTKLLAENSGRNFSEKSFEDYLRVLGIELVAVVNEEQVQKTKKRASDRLLKRVGPVMLNGGEHRSFTITLSRRRMKQLAAQAVQARREKIPASRRRKIARQAARARWRKGKKRATLPVVASPSLAPETAP